MARMDMDPSPGSSAGRLPAGAVAVPVGVEAAAAGAAAPPAGGAAAAEAAARPPTQVARVIVAWAGAAGSGGPRRVAWAAALFVLGCAAAGLALFAMNLPATDSRMLDLGDLACKTTHADVVAMRTASQTLLLAASAQVLAATLAVLVPARLVAVFAYILGWFTVDPATDVLWMLVACHDSTAHDDLSSDYGFVRFQLYATIAVGTLVSLW